MKQLFTKISLPFCLYIAIYFLNSLQNLQANEHHIAFHSKNYKPNMQNIALNLQIIQNLRMKLQSQYDEHEDNSNNNEPHEDCNAEKDTIVEIMIILTGTYEKIINATVTYYIMIHMPMQQDLHTTVALILAEDMAKIVTVLCKRLLEFGLHPSLTWKHKAWYCVWIISMIGIIKLGIDQIPKVIPDISPESLTNQEEEGAYLKEKFSNYK